MYYGIQLAASGALTSLYRTDVMANNLANLSTAGYKPDIPLARQRDVARIEDGLFDMPSNDMLESLGAGVHMAPNRVKHEQGPLEATGNDLDLAIQGDGFFVLRGLADGNNASLRFTRDGRFTLDGEGRLVNASNGLPALSVSNGTITLEPGLPVSVDAEGFVTQAGRAVARLQIADVDDRTLLKRIGHGQFTLNQDALGTARPATGTVQQGAIEGSAVNPVSAMMRIQGASRQVGSNYAMIAYQDRMMERAINTFARIG
jgi:flagellar basal-body rod protein FlgF